MISRENFEEIAKIIKDNDTRHLEDITRKYKGINIIKDLADYFQKDNPRFNRSRFLDACGVKK